MIADRIKSLRRVRAGDLLPHPKNWRRHPEGQRKAMQAALAEIGYADALLARETPEGLMLVDGHLRAELDPDQKVPVLILNVTEAEADKLLATLDPLAGLAEADLEQIRELAGSIDFDQPDLEAVVAGLLEMDDDLIDVLEVEIPEPPDTPIVQSSELWVMGRHRLLCGDSSLPGDVDRLLDGTTIHLVNTDPPYNVKVEPRSNNAIAAGISSFTAPEKKHHQKFDLARHPGKAKATHRKMRAKDRPLENDFVTDEEFDRLLEAWFGNIARVLEPGRGFYIWGGYANCGNYPPVLKRHGLYFSQSIIWDKQHPVLTRKDFMGAHEWCFYGWREGAAHQWHGPTNATDLWHVKKVNPQSMVHLTEKPVELAARSIQYSSTSGENVLDLFGGSGSTLIAAEQTDRCAYLMEIDEAYCDVILSRWLALTGESPLREDGVKYSDLLTQGSK